MTNPQARHLIQNCLSVLMDRLLCLQTVPLILYILVPFYRNTTLRTVHITDNETEISPNEFYGCTKLKNVRIGNSVTSIGDWAFSGCSSLDYFAFGSKVNTIGKEAFSDCTSVKNITSSAIKPPICGSQALDDINKWECQLNIPEGALAAYQAADQWKEFLFVNEFDIMEGDVNCDGNVDYEDVTCITNYILGQKQEVFNPKAADLNNDDKINAVDIVKLVNIILSKHQLGD